MSKDNTKNVEEQMEQVVGGKDTGSGFEKFVASYKGRTVEAVLPSGFINQHDLTTENLDGGNKEFEGVYFKVTEKDKSPLTFIWHENVDESKFFNTISGDSSKYTTDMYKTFLSMTLSKVYELLEVEDDIAISFVTGVPAKYKGTDAETQLHKSLLDLPTISANGKIFKPNVSNIGIVSQPVGTIANLRYNMNGTKNESFNEADRILIIDIGTFTTDFEVWEDGSIDKKYRHTIEKGMSDIYEAMSEKVNADANKLLGFPYLRKYLKSDGIKFGHKIVRLQDTVQKSLQENAENMKQVIITKYGDLDFFDRIVLTGGGGEPFYPYLKDLVEESQVEIELIENAHLSNAKGFYKLALIQFS